MVDLLAIHNLTLSRRSLWAELSTCERSLGGLSQWLADELTPAAVPALYRIGDSVATERLSSRWWVVTDLDGTLLDHAYDWTPAETALRWLQQREFL